MTGSGRRVLTLALASLLALCAVDRDDAGVNAFWKELGGSASGGGVSKLGANVSADSPRVAFGPDSLPVVVYGTAPASSDIPRAISVRRWTGVAWQDLSPAPAVFGFEPRLAIATNGTRYVSWLQDDGSGLQVHLLRRSTSATSWQAFGLLNSSAITAINGSVLAHALAVGTDGNPVVAFEAKVEADLPGNDRVLRGTSQIYVVAFNGVAWQYLGGDPSAGGGASNAISLTVDGANYATHAASQPSLTVVNNRPTVAFKYSTDFGAGNGSTPT